MPDYNNSGILYRNNDRKSDNHPEFKGQCTVNGREYWLAAWVKENDRGKFFSMKFDPKDKQESAGEEPQESGDVPF